MFIGIANSIGQRFGGGGFDPDAQAFLSAAGITGSTEAAAVNTLVTDLKSNNIWSKMKALYPFVTDNRNLLSYTEDFANWNTISGTITANYGIAPNGTLTADRFQGTSSIRSGRFLGIPIVSGATYTFSIYVKSLSGTQKVRIGADNSCSTPQFAQTFTIGTDWTRVSASFTSTQPNWNVFFDNIESGINCTGTNLDIDILVWGAQLEIGSSATTYQPIAGTQQSYISSQFKYNLKDPRDLDAAFRLVFNGGWTHSSTGATPNGTNGYADTKLALASHLTKGSGHLSYYSRTNSATSASTTMGDNTGGRGRIILRRTGDVCYMECGTNGADSRTYTVTDSRCYALINVISNQDVDFFKNGIKQTASAVNSSNSGWSTNYVSLGAYSLGSQFDNKECAFSSIGDGLSDTEASNLYTAVQAFQTSLSRQV